MLGVEDDDGDGGDDDDEDVDVDRSRWHRLDGSSPRLHLVRVTISTVCIYCRSLAIYPASRKSMMTL